MIRKTNEQKGMPEIIRMRRNLISEDTFNISAGKRPVSEKETRRDTVENKLIRKG